MDVSVHLERYTTDATMSNGIAKVRRALNDPLSLISLPVTMPKPHTQHQDYQNDEDVTPMLPN
ncbi:hypothetical protein N7510_001091 [Penicillium lagena]|uniref:uncharacterized protein n=1 Tax=Penicillium lagena TaxID=94218 RepID=UPI002540F593|nr:uncharacterized protein N7510_001091 [Penicillium lagena]KAJ5624782.1 hypothetical protein N7510_001091 [Penicillium lagena]